MDESGEPLRDDRAIEQWTLTAARLILVNQYGLERRYPTLLHLPDSTAAIGSRTWADELERTAPRDRGGALTPW
jgi:hypothetical protein